MCRRLVHISNDSELTASVNLMFIKEFLKIFEWIYLLICGRPDNYTSISFVSMFLSFILLSFSFSTSDRRPQQTTETLSLDYTHLALYLEKQLKAINNILQFNIINTTGVSIGLKSASCVLFWSRDVACRSRVSHVACHGLLFGSTFFNATPV